MYYPYFRGKQFDLLALSTLVTNDLLSDQIIPIIEPVKQSNTLKKWIDLFKKKKHPFYLVQNPQAGDFLTSEGQQSLKNFSVPKAFIIDQPIETLNEGTDLFIVRQATPVLQSNWQNNQVSVLIPEEFRLLERVKGNKILSQDPFTRLPKTIFYQECADELFSSTHLTFSQKGFIGFSDFSIDSRIYYDNRFLSKVMCLHLVYFENQQLRIHHFLSSNESFSQKEHFLEIMSTVTCWCKQLCDKQTTLGLQLLLDAAAQDKFPGMGVIRKASVMHHLELMSRYLIK